jgi:hypothetical protein
MKNKLLKPMLLYFFHCGDNWHRQISVGIHPYGKRVFQKTTLYRNYAIEFEEECI